MSGLVERIRPARGEPEGALRVGVSHAVSDARFARLLSGLRSRYPGVSFRLSCEWGGVLRERLKRAELDVALWLAPSNARGHHADADIRVIGTEPVSLIAAPSRKLPPTLSMAQVTEEAWVLNPAGCEMRAWLLGRYEADRLTPNVAAEVQSVPLQHALVAEGFGLGFAPVRLIGPASFWTRSDASNSLRAFRGASPSRVRATSRDLF